MKTLKVIFHIFCITGLIDLPISMLMLFEHTYVRKVNLGLFRTFFVVVVVAFFAFFLQLLLYALCSQHRAEALKAHWNKYTQKKSSIQFSPGFFFAFSFRNESLIKIEYGFGGEWGGEQGRCLSIEEYKYMYLICKVFRIRNRCFICIK